MKYNLKRRERVNGEALVAPSGHWPTKRGRRASKAGVQEDWLLA